MSPAIDAPENGSSTSGAHGMSVTCEGERAGRAEGGINRVLARGAPGAGSVAHRDEHLHLARFAAARAARRGW